MKSLTTLFVVLLLSACLIPLTMAQGQGKPGQLTISSPAFQNKGNIPKKYGCSGENVNPPLKIENVPGEAKSLALVFDDLDAPRGSYVHWILWNMDPKTKEIRENSVPEGAVQGTNDFKKQTYGGPCPPTRPHRYVLRIYALAVRLDLKSESTKKDLEKAMEAHVLAKTELVGSYKKEK